MTDQAGVDRPTCTHDGCIGIRLAKSACCLAHATVRQRRVVLRRLHQTGEIDARGVPITEDLLEQLLAAAPRDPANHPTFATARFGGATFKSIAGFDGAIFKDAAEFPGATVRRDAGFVEARFEQACQLGPLLVYSPPSWPRPPPVLRVLAGNRRIIRRWPSSVSTTRRVHEGTSTNNDDRG